MWHSGRCGSTVIADLISDDGRIVWDSEILENFSQNPPPILLANGAMLERVGQIIAAQQRSAGLKPFGFEMKLWHYKRLGLELDKVYGLLRRMRFGKHIILERRNHLRALVSGRVAFASGEWHIQKGQEVKPTLIKFNASDACLHDEIKLHEKFYEDLKATLPTESFYMSYEDDIEADPYVGYKKLIEYLGYKPKKLAVKLNKTNPKPLSEIIQNYDEVCNYLSNTPYHWMTEQQ